MDRTGRGLILGFVLGAALVAGCTTSPVLPSPTPTIRPIPAVPLPTAQVDYTGEPCRFYTDMVVRRGHLKQPVITLRRYLISLDYDGRRDTVWLGIDNVLPTMQSLLLGVAVYGEWLLRITPPSEGAGLRSLELQTVDKMQSSLLGYIQARTETDFLGILAARDGWISAMTFYSATERDLVVYDEEYHCSSI